MSPARWMLVSLAVGAAVCSAMCSSPTDPIQSPGPSLSRGGSPGSPAVLRSFTARPASIIEGEDITLSWQGENGIVSLARKGAAPFAVGLPQAGTFVLKPGSGGYPVAIGANVYEAAIGDLAQRLETAVEVAPRPTPTPTPPPASPPAVSVSGGGSCHPSPSDPCPVAFSASGVNFSSLAWSGCCSGSGAEAICAVTRPGDFTCTVTASGPGGTASASGTARGVNDTPSCGPSDVDPPSPACCNQTVTFSFSVSDEQSSGQACSVRRVEGACSCPGCAPAACVPLGVQVGVKTQNPGGGRCTVTARYTDVWGAWADCSRTVDVAPEPTPTP